MLPQSVLNMLNDATEKAYILTTLEFIKKECESHSDSEADDDEIPDVCTGCIFAQDDGLCFFSMKFEGKIPEEWDIDALSEKMKGAKI